MKLRQGMDTPIPLCLKQHLKHSKGEGSTIYLGLGSAVPNCMNWNVDFTTMDFRFLI